ncbi:hypothetical protein [Rickettsiales endosymbiont of Trichoplax sp. H2]|uniref:hypothetical protein n=1 Tax=Rickettsiales endosymbiont of Trichoplax sp. H2 TaxID=2021221 RepID=UPI0012B264AA|nr:hypothetical protein [Rickettsiales endosymbiont of Trichoplax sp. H2]MSO13569.1 Protein NLRC3 [Rickettsiales endosymbiont of Trichoplax sp. H2]
MNLNEAIKIIKDSNVPHTINLWSNNIGAQGAKDLAEQLKNSKVSHTIELEDNKIGAQGAMLLAEQLKNSKVSHTIELGYNEIGDQGAIGLGEHLKGSEVSHTINLESNEIGDQGAIGLGEHLKGSEVSHTISLESNEIGDQGAIGLAEQLKDSKVSHTIDLGSNEIRDQGIKYLEIMIKNSQFPSNIVLDTNGLDEVMQYNDAILAIREPKKFELKIEGIFSTSLPALKSTAIHIPEDAISIIVQHLGKQETNRINLQYLQDFRIRAVEFYTGEEITAARANYTIKDTLAKHKLDIGRIDKLATLMLLTENIVNLLPKEVKKEVSEHVDIKYLQYGVEGALGLGGAYLGYESEMDEWNLPLKRVGGFYFKEAIVNSLVINMESVKRMVDEYTLYEHIGEKEQNLIWEMVLGIGIGMFSPAPMLTMGVISLGAVKNYLDIEEQNIGKIGGGILGLAGAYYAGIGTYYQYVASMLSAAYVGDMLLGIKDIAVHGTDFRTDLVLKECTEDFNIKDMNHIDIHHKIEDHYTTHYDGML